MRSFAARWGARSVVVLLLAAVIPVSVETATARPASIASLPPRPIDWFAPGDSYTSGHGTPGAGNDAACRTSHDSWVYKARAALGAGFKVVGDQPQVVACTGATTDQYYKTQSDGRKHDLVTFNFGGDDVGFAPVLEQCVGGNVREAVSPLFWLHTSVSNCPPDAEIRKSIDNFETKYRTFLRHIVTDVTTPGGHVVVVGYPSIFADPFRWSGVADVTNVCNGLTDNDVNLVRGWAGKLNSMIGQAVSDLDQERVNGVRVTFVNVNDEPIVAPDGPPQSQYLFEPPDADLGRVHTLCGNGASWMIGLTDLDVYPNQFHPNSLGHDAEGELVATVIKSLDWSKLGPPQTASVEPGTPIGLDEWTPVGDTIVGPPAGDGSFTLQAGQVYWSGLKAHTTACDYRFSGEGRAVGLSGFGLVARTTFAADGSPVNGHGVQYDPESGGYRDTEYPEIETSPITSAPTDNEWHRVAIEVQGSRYKSYVDGKLVYEGTTDATCGDLYLRLWRGSVEFRNLRLEPLPAAEVVPPGTPTISSVSTITVTNPQEIVIDGTGFGTHDPFEGVLPCFSFYDLTAGWEAGHVDVADGGVQSFGPCDAPGASSADLITVGITQWTDTQIRISGLGGGYGDLSAGWVLNDGDTVRIRIANAQTGVGPVEATSVVQRSA